MLFNSIEFAIFLPVVFALYWLLPDKYRNLLLLTASCIFYMSWNAAYILLMGSCILISYTAGILIDKRPQRKKLIFGIAAVLSFLLLGYFKYYNFLIDTLHNISLMLGGGPVDLMKDILLPVGISFYTFQSVGYVADVSRGKVKAEKNLLDYAAFVSFFPQLVAGPIERTQNLLPQIKAAKVFTYEKAAYGAKLMLWGFYKKLVIADVLGAYVDRIYGNITASKGLDLIIAIIFHTIQIYCDFSGYSDIARGSAKLLGIDLMVNFRSPFFASSVSDFWRRWHISLTTWFKDYVYIPLGGNRKGMFRKDLNLMITFFLSGLWHGSAWHFVMWGCVNGFAQVIESWFKKPIEKIREKKAGRIFCTLYADAVFAAALVFFRAQNVKEGLYAFKHSFDGFLSGSWFNNGILLWPLPFAVILFSIAVMLVYDYASLKTDVIEWTAKQPALIRYGLYIFVAMMVMLFKASGSAEFVYFQF